MRSDKLKDAKSPVNPGQVSDKKDEIRPSTEEMWAATAEEDYIREMGDGESPLTPEQEFEVRNEDSLYL